MTPVEMPALAWIACVPVCALVGVLTQFVIPRDWPKASLAVAYVSLGSAAVFCLRGILSLEDPAQLYLVGFDSLGLSLAFALSTSRLVWCLLGLALTVGWILLHTRGKTHGQDAALAGGVLGFGVAVMSLSGHPWLDAVGLTAALSALWLAGVPGREAAPTCSISSLGGMLVMTALGLCVLTASWLPSPTVTPLRWVETPGIVAAPVPASIHPETVLALLLAARVLALAVVIELLWHCQRAMEHGGASRWWPLVLLGLGIALIRPVPPLAYVPMEAPFWWIALAGLGLGAGGVLALVIYTRPNVHGGLGVAAELLNQVPVLALEFVRMLIMVPLSKLTQRFANGGRGEGR